MKLKTKFTLLLTNGLIFFLMSGTVLAQLKNPSNAQVAEELFGRVARDRAKGLTQTEAQISLPKIQSKVKQLDNLTLNRQVIINCMDRERLYFKEYDTFYTSIPYTFLFQEIARMLFKRRVGSLGELANKAFQFLRFNYQDLTYSKYKTATEFLTAEVKANGVPDDNKVELKTILVSTNLSLFGNAGLTGESTWYFFNNPQPWGEINKQWLETMIKSYDYSTAFVDELIAVNDYLKDEKGNLGSVLFQIFVPKTLVDKIGYISWRLGIPYDNNYIKEMFDRVGVPVEGNNFPYEELKKVTDAFSKLWKANDPKALEIGNRLLVKIKQGAFNLASFLETYMAKPESVTGLNFYQARLLITNEGLLNPLSGIKIFREYPSITPEKLKVAKAKLKSIIAKMDEEKIKRMGPNSVIRKKSISDTQKDLENIKNRLDTAQKRLNELKTKLNKPISVGQ